MLMPQLLQLAAVLSSDSPLSRIQPHFEVMPLISVTSVCCHPVSNTAMLRKLIITASPNTRLDSMVIMLTLYVQLRATAQPADAALVKGAAALELS